MKKITRRRFLLSHVGLFSALTASSGGSTSSWVWQVAEPLPLRVQELYPAIHAGRLYVAGGIAAKLGVPYFTDRCVSFDPSSNRWRDEFDLPEPLHHAALASANNTLFLVGGFNGAYNHIWRMRDRVYQLTNEGWEAASHLPTPQAEGVLATAPDGALHLAAGQSPTGSDNVKRSDHKEVTRHLRWLPGEPRWETAAPIPTPRNSATGGWYGNELIVTGGRTAKGNLATTEIYDLGEDKWRTAAPMPLPQAGTASVISDDGLLVFGGEIFSPTAKVFAEVWHYSFDRDAWQAMPPMLTPRHGIGAGRFDNTVYVVGGATEPSGKGTSNANEALNLNEVLTSAD